MRPRLASVQGLRVNVLRTVAGLAACLGLTPGVADAWQPPRALPPADAAGVDGMEVLTRGPLHEAFAEPVVFDPRPGPLVPKEPPAPIEEAPPEQKPEGLNVQWIPGYWAWDDTRGDYLWISGLWRDMPPGRQWVPGYWAADGPGFRWVPGAWTALEQQAVDYLPAPPPSLEAGPNSPAPSAGAIWSPGYWFWYEGRYVWRPGFWVAFQPDWVWVPAHYVWTPGGYLFVTGYWDLPAVRRGACFAPIYFTQPIYAQPRFVLTPTISLVTTVLVSSLFVRPSCHQYYFGDYYAAEFRTAGIYPWFAFQQTRFGCDTVFTHYSTTIIRRDPAWLDRVRDDYRYRLENPAARPPHTYVELQRNINRSVTINNVTNVNVTNVTNVHQRSVQLDRNLVLARPIQQIAANPSVVANARFAPGLAAEDLPRFTRIDEARRQELGRRAAELTRFREQRLALEAAQRPGSAPPRRPEGGAPTLPTPRPDGQARRLAMARSPLAASPLPNQAPPHPANGPRRGPALPPTPDQAPLRPPTPRNGSSARDSSGIQAQAVGPSGREPGHATPPPRPSPPIEIHGRPGGQRPQSLLPLREHGPRPLPVPGEGTQHRLPRPLERHGGKPNGDPADPGASLRHPAPAVPPPVPGGGRGPHLPPRSAPADRGATPPAPRMHPGIPENGMGGRPFPGRNPGVGAPSPSAEHSRRIEALKQRRDELQRRLESRRESPSAPGPGSGR